MRSGINAPVCDAPPAVARPLSYHINLHSIRSNYLALRSALPSSVKVYACLKRNAYGCGAGPVGAVLAEAGVDGFGVGSILDALAIRSAGAHQPILLYPGTVPESAPLVADHDLTVSLSSEDELLAWSRTATRQLRVFVKLDAGFFRAGAMPSRALALLRAVTGTANVSLDGVYGHLSESSHSDADAHRQLSVFEAVIAEARRDGIEFPIRMISSTDSVLSYPEMDLDAVDPGLLLFGHHAAATPSRQLRLKPALSQIKTRVGSIKVLDRSAGLAPEDRGYATGMRLGVVSVGWGDGVPRPLPHRTMALVGGRRVPLLPPVHLEHLRVDLTDLPSSRVGDEVLLLGAQGQEEITIGELATSWGTDPVGVYGGLRDHVERYYSDTFENGEQ